MKIDIRGTNSFNLGAQLMLFAIMEEFGADHQLSAPPQLSEYEFRSRLGLRQTLVWNQVPRTSVALGNLVPKALAEPFGMIRHGDVEAVLDASGFAYSDSFSRRRIMREAVFDRAWKRRGRPVVLLPQAFGPFEDKGKREWAKRLLEAATLVFARDRVSLEHLRSLDPQTEVDLSPDFTIGLAARPTTAELPDRFGAVVPNGKLISSGKTSRAAYVTLLASYADAMRAIGLEPVVVVHDANDQGIADDVASATLAAVFTDPDPLVLKGVLAASSVVVSSRFHAVVSALASGVPTAALGWSHKYEQLLLDFESPQWHTHLEADAEEVLSALLSDPDAPARLLTAKAALMSENRRMWSRTRQVLGLGGADR